MWRTASYRALGYRTARDTEETWRTASYRARGGESVTERREEHQSGTTSYRTTRVTGETWRTTSMPASYTSTIRLPALESTTRPHRAAIDTSWKVHKVTSPARFFAPPGRHHVDTKHQAVNSSETYPVDDDSHPKGRKLIGTQISPNLSQAKESRPQERISKDRRSRTTSCSSTVHLRHPPLRPAGTQSTLLRVANRRIQTSIQPPLETGYLQCKVDATASQSTTSQTDSYLDPQFSYIFQHPQTHQSSATTHPKSSSPKKSHTKKSSKENHPLTLDTSPQFLAPTYKTPFASHNQISPRPKLSSQGFKINSPTSKTPINLSQNNNLPEKYESDEEMVSDEDMVENHSQNNNLPEKHESDEEMVSDEDMVENLSQPPHNIEEQSENPSEVSINSSNQLELLRIEILHPPAEQFACPICDRQYKAPYWCNMRRSLFRHIRNVHNMKATTINICRKCHDNIGSKPNNHKCNYPDPVIKKIATPDPKKALPFSCPECDFAFLNKLSLRNHTRQRERAIAFSQDQIQTNGVLY